MISHSAFPVEPWCVRETHLDLDVLAQTESVFALSNGHLGLRANLDEGEPHGLPGTYLNSFYELRPLPYAEAGYGYPEVGQTVINVPNGKLIRLLVDDEPFDVRYGRLLNHERLLDLRTGILHRRVEWESPAGTAIRVSSARLVSFTQRAVAAISYEVEPLAGPAQIVLQSELVANEVLPSLGSDPRVAAVLESPLVSELHGASGNKVLLVHATRRSGLRVASAMDHRADGPAEMVLSTESYDDVGRFTLLANVEAGQSVRLQKFLAYGWSEQRSRPALADQVGAALTGALYAGWNGLVAAQRGYLDEFWRNADVEVVGDDEVQQAVRFGLFHVLQAGARAETRAIPAKGLTGPGYDGHAFWDSETYVLPVLTYSMPHAARDALRWRHSTLPMARQHATELGLAGAAFAWRTINGEEASGYWPAGIAAFHINADIADAVVRYVAATNDVRFEEETGAEILVETARLWSSLGHLDGGGRFRIDGVTGPDEYSAVADNNVYTNLMAQQNLRAAADAAEAHDKVRDRLGVDAAEIARWRRFADAMAVPYDPQLGVHPQSEGFTSHDVWDFAGTGPDQYPLLLHFPYFDLYRKQVVKQADLVLAMQLRGDAFTAEQKARNFAYYEALTVRDSSLSAATQAVVAAEIGDLRLAHDYLCEAALMDLADLEHNTRDGVHIAALAGSWFALIGGFGGLRTWGGNLHLSPRLPPAISRIAFNLRWRDQRLTVEIGPDGVIYRATGEADIELFHHGQALRVPPRHPVRAPVPAAPEPPPIRQPDGRAPERRHSDPGRRPPA